MYNISIYKISVKCNCEQYQRCDDMMYFTSNGPVWKIWQVHPQGASNELPIVPPEFGSVSFGIIDGSLGAPGTPFRTPGIPFGALTPGLSLVGIPRSNLQTNIPEVVTKAECSDFKPTFSRVICKLKKLNPYKLGF